MNIDRVGKVQWALKGIPDYHCSEVRMYKVDEKLTVSFVTRDGGGERNYTVGLPFDLIDASDGDALVAHLEREMAKTDAGRSPKPV